jgi:hypothetical protein
LLKHFLCARKRTLKTLILWFLLASVFLDSRID